MNIYNIASNFQLLSSGGLHNFLKCYSWSKQLAFQFIKLKKNDGFAGNCIPLIAAQGGTLLFDKYFLREPHNHSMLPTLDLLRSLFATYGFALLTETAGDTLCLYHNWSQQLLTQSGPLKI